MYVGFILNAKIPRVRVYTTAVKENAAKPEGRKEKTGEDWESERGKAKREKERETRVSEIKSKPDGRKHEPQPDTAPKPSIDIETVADACHGVACHADVRKCKCARETRAFSPFARVSLAYSNKFSQRKVLFFLFTFGIARALKTAPRALRSGRFESTRASFT